MTSPKNGMESRGEWENDRMAFLAHASFMRKAVVIRGNICSGREYGTPVCVYPTARRPRTTKLVSGRAFRAVATPRSSREKSPVSRGMKRRTWSETDGRIACTNVA